MAHAEQTLMQKLSSDDYLTDEERGVLVDMINGDGEGGAGGASEDEEVAAYVAQLQKEASDLSDDELALALEAASEQVAPERQDAFVKGAAAELEVELEEMSKQAESWEQAGEHLYAGFIKAAEAHNGNGAAYADDDEGAPERGATILAALGLTE